jgi:hypothetical protein
MLYLVINYEDPVAIFDSLDKAKDFCLKQKHPGVNSISTMEINKEYYDEIYYWDYNSISKEWEESCYKQSI